MQSILLACSRFSSVVASFGLMLLLGTSAAAQPAMITCAVIVSTANTPGQCSASVAFTNLVTGNPTSDVICTLDGSAITSPHVF